MMNTLAPDKVPFYKKLILLVSIVIPIVVGALFRIRIPGDLSFLPPIYAGFNAATAILLIIALMAVKQNKIELHRLLVRLALLLSLLFLVCYLHAWAGNYQMHKKLVRFAYPIWMYVAVTGVIVYWMISPFY